MSSPFTPITNFISRILIVLFCGFFSFPVYAQYAYQGIVRDNTGKALADVTISALNSKEQIIAFCFSDEKGKFELSVTEKPASISFSYVGYKTLLIPITRFEPNATYVLTAEAIRLREVEVRSMRVKQSADTITYSVSGYKLPQDKVIADVLRKIPGIEVSSTGQIKYEDKPINKLYIEGLDLMGNRYAMTSNNLSSKTVKAVQVLRNHQTIKALQGKSFSEQASLNLILEDAAKNVLTGIVELGTGRAEDKDIRWSARFLAMLFGKTQQQLSLYKSNNTGNDVEREIRTQAGADNLNQPMEVDKLLSIPSASISSIDRERYLLNKDHLGAVNYLRKMGKESTLRVQLNFLHEKEKSRSRMYSTYYYPSSTLIYDEEQYLSNQHNQWAVEADWIKNGKKEYIRNKIIANIEHGRGNSTQFLNHTPAEQNIKLTKEEIRNVFHWVHPYGKNHVLKLTSANSYAHLPQRLHVNASLYDTLFLGTTEQIKEVRQSIDLQQFRSHTYADLQLKVAGFYLTSTAGVDYLYQRIDPTFIGKNVRGDEQNATFFTSHTFTHQDFKSYIIPTFLYRNDTWSWRLHVPISFHQLEQRGETSHRSHEVWVEPRLTMRAELNGNWELNGGISHSRNMPSIYQLYTDFLLTNYLTLQKGKTYSATDKVWAGSYGVKYSNPLHGVFAHITTSYSWAKHPNVYSAFPLKMLQIIEQRNVENISRQWSLRGQLSKSLRWWKAFISLSGNYQRNKQRHLLEEQLIPYTYHIWNGDLTYSFQPHRWINFEGLHRWRYTRLQSTITQELKVQQLHHQLKVTCIPHSRWRIAWSNLLYTHLQPRHSQIYFMDLSCAYTLPKWDWEICFNNILNRESYEQLRYTSLTEQQAIAYFRPREVLLKLSISF